MAGAFTCRRAPRQFNALVTSMYLSDGSLSRISKLFVDRDQSSVDEVLKRRKQFGITLVCGPDVASSYTQQLAVLTAANIAQRCFPGTVRLSLTPGLAEAPLLLWRPLRATFGDALHGIPASHASHYSANDHYVLFGDAAPTERSIRVTFDGWIAKTGPGEELERMAEREYCSLTGVLGAALAVSELFLQFADVSLEAGRRVTGLSLWRPDLALSDPAALGVRVQFLPRELWVLGLGHLGNAYLWSLASLPYPDPTDVEIFLNDFDRIQDANIETSLLFDDTMVRNYKTRACAGWLEKRGFQTRLVERHFDENFRCRDNEPRLALCGFDTNAARRNMATAEFLRVAESGLGGTPDNFDTINFHAFPNPRSVHDLWPDPTEAEVERVREQIQKRVEENPAYAGSGDDECGRFELAGKSIAVPFVGTVAATLAMAETLRLLHRGPAFHQIKLSMGMLQGRVAPFGGTYSAQDFAGLRSVCC